MLCLNPELNSVEFFSTLFIKTPLSNFGEIISKAAINTNISIHILQVIFMLFLVYLIYNNFLKFHSNYKLYLYYSVTNHSDSMVYPTIKLF